MLTRTSDEAVVARIMRDVVIDESGCWLWQGSLTTAGHGQVWWQGRTHGVHVLMCEEKAPRGLVIMHDCDVANCCNPGHLTIGTYVKNTTDAVRRGRHNAAKVTMVDVDEMRLRFWAGQKRKDIAKDFGISMGMVYSILQNRTWVDYSWSWKSSP